MSNWREEDHPRVPAGKDTGGQFVEKAEISAREAAGLIGSFSVYPAGLIKPYILTKKQVDALIWYQSNGGYKSINKQLREGTPLSKNAKEAVQQIDSCFVPLESDVVVFKGVSYTKRHDSLFRKNWPDVIQDDAYWSTSVRESVAKRFTHNNLILRIHLPKGYPVIPLDAVTLNDPTFSKNQAEILLPRGVSFKIVKYSEENHLFYYDLEPIPND